MNTASSHTLASILKENGYKLASSTFKSTISKNFASGPIVFILFQLTGIVFLTIGLKIGLHYTTVLSGFFFIGFSIFFDRWRYPNKVIIDKESDEIKLISGFTYRQKFRISDIEGLNVDERILSSDTSPFKEGYQDFVYSFHLKVAAHKIRLLKLIYRKQAESTVFQIFEFLNEELRLKK